MYMCQNVLSKLHACAKFVFEIFRVRCFVNERLIAVSMCVRVSSALVHHFLKLLLSSNKTHDKETIKDKFKTFKKKTEGENYALKCKRKAFQFGIEKKTKKKKKA